MPDFFVIVVLFVFISSSECYLFHNLVPDHNAGQFVGNPLYSFASPMAGSNQNSVSGGGTSSKFPPPQVPQILIDALNTQGPPQAAAPAPNFLSSFFSMLSGAGGGQGSGQPASTSGGQQMPVSAGMKQMVNKWATQLGHKAYYEAHGCVDPSATLHGRHSQMASMAMMFGCQSPQAAEVCELAQLAHSGAQGANMRMMLEMIMKNPMKAMLEKCLSPSTLMNGMMGSNQVSSVQPGGLTPPMGAAGSPGGQSSGIDCSGVSQMLMMNPNAGEGLLSPEGMEQIGTLRNRYFKMSCQENVILGTLPYRMCCPGYVRPPTMEEAMMLKGMAAGA
ncbi:hypothetical protein Btru_064558 [Bulinus truncatus]|nr:hypothetical protein Btru_064558 [Bulinus truncatus]